MGHGQAARRARQSICIAIAVLHSIACGTNAADRRDEPSPDAAGTDGPGHPPTGDGGIDHPSQSDAATSDGGVDDDAAGKPPARCAIRSGVDRAWQKLSGGKLFGAHIVGLDQVNVSLFAPRATEVTLVGAFNGWDAKATPLTRTDEGVWSTTLTLPDPHGTEYRFSVDGRSVADPYAFANDNNGGNSIVIDRKYDAFSDRDFVRPPRASLVIYEVNVSDFSRHDDDAVPAKEQGKFAGFEKKIDHLQRLGVNAVELMPVVENQSNDYSWGYNASLFFAPESSLASSSKGEQVRELKHLVNALHEAGIAVILDVVYNHVWGQTGPNHFWGVDPLYYFDYDADGDAEDDKLSWGYKMASWRDGVRKLMYDNMKYLMSEVHIDGFRIDSTENMDIGAVLDVVGALDDDGYCDRYYIVEEFSAEHNKMIRERNKALGRTLISSWGTGYKNRVWDAIQWKAGSKSDLTNVTYYSRNDGWSRSDEVIQYVTSHDEGTLSTRFKASKEQVKVAATQLLTAPGIPMMWAGDEMLRVHWGNYHPGGGGQNVREENNRIDWSLAQVNADLVNYYAELIQLRIAHPALHGALSGPIGDAFVWNNKDPESAIGYVRKGSGTDRDFVVLLNFEENEQTFEVAFPKQGRYRVVAQDGKATSDAAGLSTFQVDKAVTPVKVAPFSATVFMGE